MSVKDRIGWCMYRRALEEDKRVGEMLFFESTSTSTGLAIVAMCNIHGS
ncbi:MAG: hypothetical protein ACO2OS_06620 [Thermosphaera aggregans]|jgi:cysteine synthase